MSLLLKLAAIAAILAALWGAEQYIEGIGAAKQLARDQVAADALKRDAARVLSVETAKAASATAALAEFRVNQENIDEKAKTTIDELAQALQLAARRPAGGGRLRDPNAVDGCRAGGSGSTAPVATTSDNRAADRAETGGLLSEKLTGLLQRLTFEADTINSAYAACRADGQALRTAQE